MVVEEHNCSESLKLEDSSREGAMIYYKRKRARRSSPDAIQVDMPSRKERIKDIGWDHGKIVDGNRLQWMCNWCGLVRYGGASRLKKHLAGGCNVTKCPNVPNHIAKKIMNYIIEKRKLRNDRPVTRNGNKGRRQNRSPHGDLIDKDPRKGYIETPVGSANHLSREATQQSKIAIQQSKITTQQSTSTSGLSGMTKGVKELHDTISCTSTIGEDRHSRRERHWKYVLETILQFPDMSEGGGISCCIRDALTYGPEFTKKFKRIGISRDTAQLKDKFVRDSEVKCHQTPDSATNVEMNASKTVSLSQTDTNVNNIKCQNVFLDILRSEKFALLCDLVCRTFQDNKVKLFFDFSLINSKMKNGDYEQSPGLFNQDIQEVWDKCQKFGQEMVLLASSLSSMSQASCRKQETCQVVAERKSFVESNNATAQFILYESGRSTKPAQAEASVLYKVLTCQQCGKEANGECSLICTECQALYHISCIKPALAEIPTQRWYCVVCSEYKKESPEPFSTGTKKDSLHKNCLDCDGLKASETQEDHNDNDSRIVIASDSIESSVPCMATDEPSELLRTVRRLVAEKASQEGASGSGDAVDGATITTAEREVVREAPSLIVIEDSQNDEAVPLDHVVVPFAGVVRDAPPEDTSSSVPSGVLNVTMISTTTPCPSTSGAEVSGSRVGGSESHGCTPVSLPQGGTQLEFSFTSLVVIGTAPSEMFRHQFQQVAQGLVSSFLQTLLSVGNSIGLAEFIESSAAVTRALAGLGVSLDGWVAFCDKVRADVAQMEEHQRALAGVDVLDSAMEEATAALASAEEMVTQHGSELETAKSALYESESDIQTCRQRHHFALEIAHDLDKMLAELRSLSQKLAVEIQQREERLGILHQDHKSRERAVKIGEVQLQHFQGIRDQAYVRCQVVSEARGKLTTHQEAIVRLRERLRTSAQQL